MTAPSDLELMMYFDGELEEPRCSEVRAFLAAGASGAISKQKLAGLSLVSGVVREHSLSRAEPASLTDDVMAKILAEPETALKIGLDKARSEPPPARAKAATSNVRSIGSARVESTKQPANDNGKLIYGLAAAAAAAAAAMFIWGRTTANEPIETARGTAAPTQTAAEVEPAPTVAQLPDATVQAPTTSAPDPTEDEPQRSVEVASVDFGSRPGLVYYVSGEDRAMATTVVWVRDE